MKYSPYYTQNLEALAATKQPVAAWLIAEQPNLEEIDTRIGMNRWDALDYRLSDGRYIFENMPPAPLYQGWTPKQHSNADATFIIGSNIGYGINHLLVNTPDTHTIYVIEPRADILAACLGQTDYRPYIQRGKIRFIPPHRETLHDVVRKCDTQFLFGKIHMRADVACQQIGPEYAKWMRACREMLEGLSVELRTLRKAQDTMVGNELDNFRRAIASGSINPLKGCGEGLKATIIGAGPSLAEFGPKFAKLKNSSLITAAVQTLPAMQRVGLKPHFCMSIDFSDGMLDIFKRLDAEWAKDIPLIYSTKTKKEVVDNYPGPTIPLWTVGGLATFIAGKNDLVLDAAGNVSVALMRLLHWMGIKDIMLIGQDYAWNDSGTHAEGHHAACGGVDKESTVTLQALDGSTIHSSIQYVTAARDMEQDIRTLNLNVFNIYGGGYVMEPATNASLKDAMDAGMLTSAPGSLEMLKLRLAEAQLPCEQPVFEERFVSWRTSLRHAQKRLEKLFKKPERNVGEIRKMFDTIHMFLRQDPVYMPFLYNEIMDIGGLRDARVKYGPKDLSQFKKLTKRVLEKVQRMDNVLGTASLKEHQAA